MLLLLRELPCLVVVGIEDGKGSLRVPVHHNRDQFIGILRSLDQNHRRAVCLDHFSDMVRTGGTVMSDREQDYFSHFLAS